MDATLGYAGIYTVVNPGPGHLTALPTVGQIVSQGQVLYQVSTRPVVLLYGSTPAYRSLSEGACGIGRHRTRRRRAQRRPGGAGLRHRRGAEPHLGRVRLLDQGRGGEAAGHVSARPRTASLALGQAVFVPSAARITTVTATLGAPAQPGQPVLTATSTTREVTIALDAAQQSEVKVGDKVTHHPAQQPDHARAGVRYRYRRYCAGLGCHQHVADNLRGGHSDRPGCDRQSRPGPGGGIDHHRQRYERTCRARRCPASPGQRWLRRRGGFIRPASTRWCRSHSDCSTTPMVWCRSAVRT